MSEIRTIPEKILVSGIKDTSIDTVGSFSKKVIHHNAGAPTVADDTGLGYVVGSIWVDTTNGDMYTATSVAAENATWINQEGTSVNLPTMAGSTYGIVAQGGSSATPPYGSEDSILTWSMTSPFSMNDWGEISPSGPTVGGIQKSGQGSMRTSTDAYIAGGSDGTQNTPTRVDMIKKFNLASPASATDVGEMSQVKDDMATGCDLTYGAMAGGGTHPNARVDTIDIMTLSASPGNSVDGGSELSRTVQHTCGASYAADASMFVIAGNSGPGSSPGPSTGSSERIEKFKVQLSPGTVTDWGETTQGNTRMSACSDNTNVFAMGGVSDVTDYSYSDMDQWAVSSGGAATNWGELAYLTCNSTSHTGETYMWTAGGKGPPNEMTQEVDRFSNSSSGNAADQGDLGTDKTFHYGTEV